MKKNLPGMLSFATLCTVLVVVASCAPVPSPTPAAPPPPVTLATPRVSTATPSPSSTATLTPTATRTETPSPTATLGPTNTPTPLPNHLKGRVLGFSNNVLTIALDGGGTITLTVTEQIPVTVMPAEPVAGFPYSPVAKPFDALQEAVRENAPVQVWTKDNTLQAIVLSLLDAVATTFPTETTQQGMARHTQLITQLTPTPAGFVPTPTPVLAPRFVDMPWGRINLDLPMAQSNDYAMSVWCWRNVVLISADLLPQWATNPNSIFFNHPNSRSVLNIEVIGKDTDWSVDSQGRKYFNAISVVRNTPNKSDTQRFVLQIYYNAPLAVNMPTDSRLDGSVKNWLEFTSVPNTITDINQIRIGQIYGLLEYPLSWGGDPNVPGRSFVEIGQPWFRSLAIYTIPVAYEGTCAYEREQYKNGYWPTPRGGLDPKWQLPSPWGY
jgi:hypothetical protein